ncbi:MAG: sulfotransferase [Gammaproteobacteria bacterium]|nr:sulfotransferase [Gammaproteobacteria bacterium]
MPAATATKAPFDEVIALVGAGDTERAEALCSEAVQRDGRDVNMLALHGAVLLKMRRMTDAEQALRRAIALAPSFAKPREDLGQLLLRTGRTQEAATELRHAVRLEPALDQAWFNLGKALAALGHGREADAAFERSFELVPERKALAYASKAHHEGKLDEAERAYRDVLRRNPGNVDALRLLAGIALQARRQDEAERLLRKALALAPDFVAAHVDLAQLLKEQDRIEEAIESLRAALGIEPDNARTHFLLGGTLAPAALTHEAIESYRRALALNPNHAGAWLGLGHTLKTVGNVDEAIHAYHESARLRPNNGEIYWSLANLKTYRFSDAEVAAMEEKIAAGKLSMLSEVNMLFALGKACEDRADYERAWDRYARGNARRREDEWYDPVQTQVLHDSIVDTFDRALLDSHAGGGDPDPAPIFIVGLPRSGSTLLEQILASHSQVEGTAELPYIGRVVNSLHLNRADGVNYPAAVRELGDSNLRDLGREYLRLSLLHRCRGAPRFIDKMPNNFPHIGFIHLILPNARIVDARRHPLDACVSCFRQLFARGQPFTYDLVDIGEYYLQYRKLMDHWHNVLPGKVLTVQYEELVGDFENQVRRLLDYCGLPFEDNCLRFHETERPVRTPSSEQVRRPVNTEAIGRWRHYEKHLDALKEVLQPLL